MNKSIYDSLSTEEQDSLCSYFAEIVDKSIASREERETELLETCKNTYGVEVIHLSDEEQQKMRTSNGVVIELLKDNLGDAMVEQYLQLTGYSE